MRRDALVGARGQASLLLLGVLVAGLLISGLALDGTRLFLARRSAVNAADAAALAGASQLDEAVIRSSGGLLVQLDPEAASRAAYAVLLGEHGVVRADPDAVAVHVDENVSMILLRFLGVQRVGASAVARPRMP